MLIGIDLKAYTAGIIDGEGSIQINPVISGKRYYWGLTIQVSSGDKRTLEELRREWGDIGKVSTWKPKGSRKNRVSCNWRLYDKQADFLLKNVLQFLRIKRKHAEIALEFRKYRGDKPFSLTPQKIKKRKILALKLRGLNQKYGKARVSNIWLKREIR